MSSDCNALVVPFLQLLEGPMDVLLCQRVNDLRHLLNCLITTVSDLREITKSQKDQRLDYRDGEELS